MGHLSESGAYRVPTAAMDELVWGQGLPAPDIVKMDVEGAELMVLAGMRRFFADNQVVLQVETTDETRGQVDDFMTQAGYRALGCLGADAYYSNIQAS